MPLFSIGEAAGVILELADHGKAEVWAAMTGVIGALVRSAHHPTDLIPG
jgi:hypothetical protein